VPLTHGQITVAPGALFLNSRIKTHLITNQETFSFSERPLFVLLHYFFKMLKKIIDNRLSKLNRRKKWRAVGSYRKRAL